LDIATESEGYLKLELSIKSAKSIILELLLVFVTNDSWNDQRNVYYCTSFIGESFYNSFLSVTLDYIINNN